MGIVANVLSSTADASLVKRYVDPSVKLEWAAMYPLVTLLRALKKKQTVDQAKVEWVERTLYPQQVAVTLTVTAGQTTFSLSSGHGARLRVNDILFNPVTEELLRVTAISNDDVTATRGYRGTTAAAISSGQTLVIMNAVQKEQDAPPEARYQEANAKYNMIEIFEELIPVSDLDRIISRYALENHEAQMEREAYARLLLQIEKALFFGKRSDDGAANRETSMGGLNYFVTSNVLNTTTLSWTAFNNTLKAAFQRGAQPENCVIFAGDTLLGALRTWVEGIQGYQVRLEVTDTILGTQIHKVAIPGYGVVDIVRHPLFGTPYLNTPGWGFLVHLPDLALAVVDGLDIRLVDIPNTAARVKQKKWSAYYSLIVGNEFHHAIFKNITAISTS
jgi:hypothetical protein